MSPNESALLTEILKAKGATLPCPRCGNRTFSVLGDANFQLGSTVGAGLQGMFGTQVPAVVVGCNNCGHLMLHSKSALRDGNAAAEPHSALAAARRNFGG